MSKLASLVNIPWKREPETCSALLLKKNFSDGGTNDLDTVKIYSWCITRWHFTVVSGCGDWLSWLSSLCLAEKMRRQRKRKFLSPTRENWKRNAHTVQKRAKRRRLLSPFFSRKYCRCNMLCKSARNKYNMRRNQSAGTKIRKRWYRSN